MAKIFCLFLVLIFSVRSTAGINFYTTVRHSVNEYRAVKRTKGENQKNKYGDWYNCILIAKGDTIHAKVKPKYEYFGKGSFNVVFNDGKERTLSPADIAALWILNSKDTIQYVTLNYTENVTGQYVTKLFRVVVEGKCRLLYSEALKWGDDPRRDAYTGAATIYYKGERWNIRIDPKNFIMDPKTDFRKIGREALVECPQITYRIEAGQYKADDLRKIIEAFNKCIQ